jgi:hypothetical protein
MPSTAERNAAFDAVKPHIMQIVSPMFQGYINDKTILQLCDAALMAAEKVRTKV